jgi:uncharacterized membrane protein YkvA (DUF1232 family)
MVLVAALGYFILPADLIADIIPGLGFTDDIAFLSYAITTVTDYLSPEIKEKAQQKLGVNYQREEVQPPKKATH